MVYLIGQFWLWLLAAFALGLAVGWFTFRGRDGAFWRGLIPWAVLLGVGILIAAGRFFRDGPGFWVDLGMLLAGCYFIGCFLGMSGRAGGGGDRATRREDRAGCAGARTPLLPLLLIPHPLLRPFP